MAENGLLELSGTVEHVVYHNDKNQYTVLEMAAGEELVTVVGEFPPLGSSLRPKPLSVPALPQPLP